MRHRGWSGPAIAAFSCTAYLLLCASFVLIPRAVVGERIWDRYFVLAVEAAADVAEVSRALVESGFPGLVSASTAEVEFADFGGPGRVTVADLDRRFLPEDPRFDPYMRALKGYFFAQDGAYHLLYVPSTENPLLFFVRIGEVLGGLRWKLADWNPLVQGLYMLCFMVIAVVAFVRYPGLRFLSPALALPWLLYLMHAGPAGFTAACILFSLTVYVLEDAVPAFKQRMAYGSGGAYTPELRKRIFRLLLAVGGSLCLTLYPGLDAAVLLPLLICVAASAAVCMTAACLVARGLERREHRPFEPVFLMPRGARWAGTAAVSRAFGGLLSALLVLPFLIPLSAGVLGLAVPRPLAGFRGLSVAALEQLWLAHPEQRLPDLADYLAHRAYQDGFMYGAIFDFPRIGSSVSLSEFELDGQSIRERERVVVTYDEVWYKDALSGDHGVGVHTILLSQNNAHSVVKAVRYPVGIGYIFLHVIVLFLLAAPFLGALPAARTAVFDLKSSVVRRKQQEA